jgi:hypothetical protein
MREFSSFKINTFLKLVFAVYLSNFWGVWGHTWSEATTDHAELS